MIARGSMTSRILAIATVNVLVLAVAAAAFARWQMRQEFDSFLLAGAGERILAVSRTLQADLETTPAVGRDALLSRLSAEHGATFLLVLNDGTRIAGTTIGLPGDVRRRLGPLTLPTPPPPGQRPQAGPLFLVRSLGQPRYWIGVRTPIPEPGRFPPQPGTLLIASDRFFTNPFFFDLWPWVGLIAAALLLSVACWLPWVLGLARDIRRIDAATAQVAGGRFDVRLQVRRRDEVGRLAASLTDMAGRLSTLVAGQKRFLGDAAHELRSPLARMQVALDLLDRPDAGVPDARLQDLRDDVAEMGAITDALLALSRAELGEGSGVPVDLRLAEVVDRAVRLEAGGADVRVDVPPALTVHAVPDLLSRALRNVIRNAVFYAGDAGPIEITAVQDQSRTVIAVADHGPGVPDDQLDRVFTPFYRLDASRDRHSGGTGLGLAIVRASVEASGGTVSCRNRDPHGLVVSMTMPLSA